MTGPKASLAREGSDEVDELFDAARRMAVRSRGGTRPDWKLVWAEARRRRIRRVVLAVSAGALAAAAAAVLIVAPFRSAPSSAAPRVARRHDGASNILPSCVGVRRPRASGRVSLRRSRPRRWPLGAGSVRRAHTGRSDLGRGHAFRRFRRPDLRPPWRCWTATSVPGLPGETSPSVRTGNGTAVLRRLPASARPGGRRWSRSSPAAPKRCRDRRADRRLGSRWPRVGGRRWSGRRVRYCCRACFAGCGTCPGPRIPPPAARTGFGDGPTARGHGQPALSPGRRRWPPDGGEAIDLLGQAADIARRRPSPG